MERLTRITEIGNAYFPKCFEEPCCGMGKCIDNNCNLVNEVCNKLAEHEELEERLHKIFGEESTFSLADVIDTLEMKLSEPDKKHPVNARILTYEEADKWEEYKNLEEQGLIVRLPCKVGDDLYCIVNGEVKKLKVHSFGVPDFEIIDIEFKYVDGFKIVRFVGEVGKTVFLTREKAVNKLKEMKNE